MRCRQDSADSFDRIRAWCERWVLAAPLLLVMSAGAAGAQFVDATARLGFPARTAPWPDGTHAMPEMTGGGVALLDFDGDGDLDVLQSRHPPPTNPTAKAPNRLFAQIENGKFREVTETSGLGDPGFGQGIAIGDIDNDGDPDVYFTNVGRDALYRNNGDGTFSNISDAAGISGAHWSTSATFVDFDRDGFLDLYVAHFVRYDPSVRCEEGNGMISYCGPRSFEGTVDKLYRNRGNGTFEDATKAAGINIAGKGLGVVCADLTGDGWQDCYVANDGEVNQFWVNDGTGRFLDEAVIRGVGFNGYGEAEASMGVAAADANGDGLLDLYMSHDRRETNTLYTSGEGALFDDATDAAGLGVVDLPFTGFGCGFFDFDNDGDLDLAVANGRVKRGPRLKGANVGDFWHDYAETNLLLENTGRGRFVDAAAKAGDFGRGIEVSRGLAFGDIDDDGDVDLVIGNLGGPPRVFLNSNNNGHHWLSVRLIGRYGRDAIGAKVMVFAGARQWVRLAVRGYSYLSSNDARVHFGLGGAESIDAIEVLWPDGRSERFAKNLERGVDRAFRLVYGGSSR